MKTGTQTNPYTWMFYSNTIHTSQKVEKNLDVCQWMNGETMFYMHIVEYHLAIKRNEILIHATT